MRIVMNALGVAGFGLFSAVSGAVSLIFFLQWTMELTVRRFLCVEIGADDAVGLSRSFSAGVMLAVAVCVAFVLVGETGGRWFVLTQMAYDKSLTDAAVYVLQMSIAFSAVETLRLPFEALIVASERMSFFAKVSVVEALLSLAAAVLASVFCGRGLEVYVTLLALKSVVVMVISWHYCRRRFPSVTAGFALEWRRFADQGLFFLKTMLSDVANMFKNQGVNMLVNVYAGVAYNASWSLSMRIGSSLYGLVANFQQAYFPQIVRLWPHEDKRPFVVLMAGALRWSLIIMGVCTLPLFVLAGPLLVWWIGGQLPPEAVHFTRCVAVYLFFDALIGPLHTAIVATGRVFAYNVCVSSVMVSGFFLAWLCLSFGLPPWTSVGSVAFANVLAFIYRLCYVHRNLGVSVVQILRRAFVPTNVI